MPAGGLAVAGAAGLGTAIAGSIAANKQAEAANQAHQAALQQWLNVNVPDPAQQAIELQHYKVTGHLTPQHETAFQQAQTELKNLKVDPTSRAAEVEALSRMTDLSKNGGLDAQAKQQEAQAINAANTNERGQRGAIVQNFSARGLGGSGAQLAAELSAEQGDADRSAAGGMSSAANAEQRALQALSSSGTMASNLNSQDYSQAAKAAEAQDAINRFNTSNSQNVSNTNTAAENDAQKYNLNLEQNTSNSNVDLANKQEVANKGLYQQQFGNQTQVASGRANAENGVANQANTNANRTANQWAGIGSAIGQGAGAVAQYNNNKPAAKRDEGPDEEVA